MGPVTFGSGDAPLDESCVRGEFDPVRLASNLRLRDSKLALVLLTDELMSSLGRFSEVAKETRSAKDPEGCAFILQGGVGVLDATSSVSS